ncbi:Gfo/Idh/MocA family oxidoreductase [Cryobacterium sp. 10S3]|uniref:Gfo/Idh/MocA family oxidoreductase n=1 Tax=Cryobacterium sp. 10S3 TaxID=3048582 RepID=UPI002AC980A8|nr:Gfo/Idh/MocA family oxidoreductase [Cryobacterium sp. 10S3]MEB0287495.1 Gfo/Idh/MocA family oxidoreductase [Cryobacterium sp. 10S3]WPX13281.1 Gfo/Idh/MocA family oxidoreductase [Cryobacterium sp. 10S3]
MLTIAYIGNGKSANRYHLPFVLKNPNFSVKTIYSPAATSPWEQIPGVNYVTDIEEIWRDADIDLVVVCTPSNTHAEYAREILNHGKNALVEKPFAETPDEARELFALAKERGLFLQCYQNRRFDSDFLTVQKVINSGVLGDLLEVESHYDYYRPEVPTTLVPKFSKNYSFLLGHGTHTVDQVIGFFGRPESVRYDVRQLLGPGRLNDYFDLDFYYGVLKVSIKSSYFRIKARPSFVVYGKKGMFIKDSMDRQEEHLKLSYLPGRPGFGVDLPEHYGTLTYFDDDGVYHEEKVVSEIGGYGRVYEGAYQSIVNGAPKVVSDDETIEQLIVLETGIRLITKGNEDL